MAAGSFNPWRGGAQAALAAALIAAAPAQAQQDTLYASAVSKSAHSTARLLSSGPPSAGVYIAGVEIALDPGTITYWRQPGDAGSPPLFDFSRSENVASLEVLYPAPKHIKEADSLVAGYDEAVIFPLRIKPQDAGKPVTLRLSLDYAACGKICLPAKAQLSLALPKDGASPFSQTILAAQKLVPRKLTEAESKKLISVEFTPKGDLYPYATVWTLHFSGAEKARDLFAEAPEPLFLESKVIGEGKAFAVGLPPSSSGSEGKKPQGGVAATLTFVTPNGAVEAPVRLD